MTTHSVPSDHVLMISDTISVGGVELWPLYITTIHVHNYLPCVHVVYTRASMPIALLPIVQAVYCLHRFSRLVRPHDIVYVADTQTDCIQQFVFRSENSKTIQPGNNV